MAVALFVVDRPGAGRDLATLQTASTCGATRLVLFQLDDQMCAAAAAAMKVFLTVHRIERDEAACDVKLFQQFLRRRYFVRFFVDLDMRQHQSVSTAKALISAWLCRRGIVELPSELCHPAPRSGLKRRRLAVFRSRRAAKNCSTWRVQSTQNAADQVWPAVFSIAVQGFVQPLPMNLDKRANAPVRIGSRDDRQDRNSST